MPKIIRIGAGDIEQTHVLPDGFGAKPPDGPGSPDVFVETYNAAIVGDEYPDHECPGCCGSDCTITHSGRFALGGSPTVFINGVGVHRDGDLINCGAAADNGAPTVFANGGGEGPASQGGDSTDFTGYIIDPPVWVGPTLINPTIGVTEGQPDPLGDIPYTYDWGCQYDSGIPNAYTVIVEEESGNLFSNYPPEHDPAGCPTCPPEANEQAKTPIDLTFNFWEVSYDPITMEETETPTTGMFGLVFETQTGAITGCPVVDTYTTAPPSATIRVRPDNSFSIGRTTDIILQFNVVVDGTPPQGCNTC